MAMASWRHGAEQNGGIKQNIDNSEKS